MTSALRHPMITTAADGEDVAIDQFINAHHAAEFADLNPGESLATYFAQRYNWSVLSRLASDPELIGKYSPPIRVPIYPSSHDGGFSGGSAI